MKKFILLFLFVTTATVSMAQNLSNAAALALVEKNMGSIGLSKADLNNSIVSNAYLSEISGTQIIYLQQSYQGIPVFNQLQTLAFKNGQLVSKAGERINSIENRVHQSNANAAISPLPAIKAAMINKNIPNGEQLLRIAVSGDKKINFEKLKGTKEKITAELMWVPLSQGKELKLAWQINLSPSATTDNWLIRVDAADNKIIGETNLTVYCNFDVSEDDRLPANIDKTFAKNKLQTGAEGTSPLIVNGASYRVIAYPAESPIHPGGAPALQSNPWSLSTGNAVSLKWHSDGTNDYNYTRGNNAWAYHDRSNTNTADLAKSATSTTSPDPLTFDFVPDFTITPTQTTPVQNQQFNITNLFYWNNIIHDLTYQYGFDEVAGNFQASNQGRGGLGNDYVMAEAQDGGSTNNANFNSPADGGSGRMQMYLWSGTPQKDGDADNAIIVHEFSHGISGRLTGGPAQAGCLGNDEQMGEGWSDYYALMATQNWATAALSDGFNNPRGIGTYANGQAITGLGIRPRRYTTNMANNEMTYANLPTQVIPHGVGFVWCTMLWDMTWEIIQQAGINPNLFNASGTGGNTIALKLVTEAMKLQPCSPGFVDGRNAILQADQILYGGQYRCAIVNAFARRGLGFDASQGSSGSRTDGVAGFSVVESILKLTQNVTQQLEGQNITYTNKVSAGVCSGLTNYLLTDTLPANVTYVSGGSYTAATRVVSFAVNIAAGQTQNYSFTVLLNNGSWFPTANLLDEQVLTNIIPSNWSISSIDANNFTVSSTKSHSTPNAFFGANASTASDFRIATNLPVAIGANPTLLSFWHNFDTEDGWDGGMVEISTDAGASWTDLGPNMIVNGYNGSMGSGSSNPLAGRAAFTGNSNGFIKTTISLSPFANKNALIRFRAASDDNTAIAGWYIDDILIQTQALVNMRSSLFNSLGKRLNLSDTSTIILQNVSCNVAAISSQPTNTNSCAGSNASFSVSATGTSINYQWQLSIDGGATYNNISGATAATLNLNAVNNAMNNYRYRIIISNACPSTITSSAAVLTVSNAALITTHPLNANPCLNSSTTFSVAASGSSLTYQWQLSTDAGISFNNIAGANNASINLANISAAMNNNQYRVIVFSCGPVGTISNAATLAVTNPAIITAQPVNATVCPGDNASFSVTANGSALNYQWQLSTDNGVTYFNLTGATSASLNLSGVNLAMNANRYRVIINGTCTVDLTSAAAILSVNTPVSIVTQPISNAVCEGSSKSFSVAAAGTTLTYQWQVSVNGSAFVNLANNPQYSGINNAILTINSASIILNGNSYRVIVTGTPCGSVVSSSASLVVNRLPAVVLIAAAYNKLTPGLHTTLFTTISPAGSYTYKWYLNNVLLPAVSAASYPVDVDGLGNYSVNITDINGCSTLSNIVNVSDSASNNLFIYPNPTSGKFQVRYYFKNGINAPGRTIVVYNAMGARVLTQAFTAAATYDRMDVNLTNMQSGVYLVELRETTGKRLATGTVIVQ